MTSSLRVTALALAAGTGLGASGALADGYFGGSIKDAPVVSVDSWSGLYIGAAVGYGVATTEVDVSKQKWKRQKEDWGAKHSLLNLDGLSSEGALGTLTLGYDHQVTPGLLIGVFGDYTFGDLDNDISVINGLGKVTSQLGDSWSVGARIGLVRDKTLWYVMAGYTETDLDWDIHLFKTKVASGGETLDGYFVGLGVEHQLFHNVSLKLDYRYSDYDGLDLSHEYRKYCKDYKLNVETDTEVHAVRLGLNVKLNNLFEREIAAAPLK